MTRLFFNLNTKNDETCFTSLGRGRGFLSDTPPEESAGPAPYDTQLINKQIPTLLGSTKDNKVEIDDFYDDSQFNSISFKFMIVVWNFLIQYDCQCL